jgi:CBS domain-containing protein
MNAAQIMTRKVVKIGPATSAREIARILVRHKVSAVPVVDKSGAVIGIVSEGDLVGSRDVARHERSAWWLEMLADGMEWEPGFLDYVRSGGRNAADLMTREVIAIAESTPVAEIAHMLETRGIKRVPVLRDDRLVGIVSRGDLIRLLAHDEEQQPPEA